ncbi:hypothetical protein [Arthrobacter alpinus]|nr:hypothetical protein [Arthrobacter alpinus]
MMIHPDRRTLSELADLLSKRKRAASWWDHSHITRRLASFEDAEEYRRLPAGKRYVLLQAARFSAHYYSVATLPVLALAMALLIPTTLKLADSLKIAVDVQLTSTVAIVVTLIVFGILDLYGASQKAAHAKTWVSAFEDAEKHLPLYPSRPTYPAHPPRALGTASVDSGFTGPQ